MAAGGRLAGQTPTEHGAGPTTRLLTALPVSSLPLSPLTSSPCPVALADVVVSSDILGHHRAACAEVGVLWETGRRVGVRGRTGVPGSRETRRDERDGLRFRCDLIQSEGRTPSGSRGGRIVPLWRRTSCGFVPGGWHGQNRCSVTK